MALRGKIGTALSLAAFGVLVAVAPAQALTLGTTTAGGAGTNGACNTANWAIQASTDGTYDYTVPAGGGAIDSWSIMTSGATAHTPFGLVLARPQPGGSYEIIGSDAEMVPSPVPTVSTFTLATPIDVQAGDMVGVQGSAASTVGCVFAGSPLVPLDIVGIGTGAPPVGSTAASSGRTPRTCSISQRTSSRARTSVSRSVRSSPQSLPGPMLRSYSPLPIRARRLGPRRSPTRFRPTCPLRRSPATARARSPVRLSRARYPALRPRSR
jgi:hypothetical protein